MAPSQGFAQVDRTAAAGVRIQALQHLDAGVERAVLALVRAGGAVPAAVGKLLVDQVRHQVVETGRLAEVVAAVACGMQAVPRSRDAPATPPFHNRSQPRSAARCCGSGLCKAGAGVYVVDVRQAVDAAAVPSRS